MSSNTVPRPFAAQRPSAPGQPNMFPVLRRWVVQLEARTGRQEWRISSDGLNAEDFPAETVAIRFEDGSLVQFNRAFHLTDPEQRPGMVAIFSEHCGYHEFRLSADDKLTAAPTSSFA